MKSKDILLWVFYLINETEKETSISTVISFVLDSLSTVAGTFLSIVTGVGILFGMSYLKSLKEKKLAASFSFWSQIKLKIVRLQNYLLWNKEIINNLYSTESRLYWEEKEVAMEQLQEFKKLASEVLGYLDKTPDQMPAYKGWSNDMINFIDFLSKIVQYDICKSDDIFLNKKIVEKEERDLYYADICKTMKNLIDGIQKGQTDLENKLFSDKKTH